MNGPQQNHFKQRQERSLLEIVHQESASEGARSNISDDSASQKKDEMCAQLDEMRGRLLKALDWELQVCAKMCNAGSVGYTFSVTLV
jgi:hypothetical protein